jgi:hypothetical protein
MSIVIASEDRALSCAEEMTGKTVVRGRVCNRAGCGRLLVIKSGALDYHRQFCGPKCLGADRREKLENQRAGLKGAKCSRCGRQSTGDHRFQRSVPLHTPPNLDAPPEGVWGVLKVGWGPPGASQHEIATVARRVDLPGTPK